MSLQRFAPAAIAVACLAVCVSANAQSDSAFRFSGFGTIGASHTDNGQVEFLVPGQKAAGHGATSSGFSFVPDTKLGVQGDYKLNNTFSGTVQLVSQYNGKGTYDPSVEWAFVKAKFLNDWSVRGGRITTPTFMISDYRQVNFANLWVRPPIEVYSQVPFNHTDGADVTYQHSFGSTTVSSAIFAGKAKSVYNTADVELKNSVGINLSAETDSGWTFRYGYSQGDLTVASARFQELVTSTNAYMSSPSVALNPATLPYRTAATQMLNTLTTQGDRASFSGFGASWDSGNWVLSGEYTKRKAGGNISDTTGWYASAGYRVGKFTPYMYAAELKVDKLKLSNPMTLLPGAYFANPATGILSAQTDYVIGLQDLGQQTIAIGSRWDAWRNVALKAQLEIIKPQGAATGQLQAPPPPKVPGATAPSLSGKTVNVLSLTADFVF